MLYMFVMSVIALALAGVIFGGSWLGAKEPHPRDLPTRKIARIVAAVVALIGLGFGVGASVYRQDVGQASVVVNAGGTIAGTNSDPGFALKAPWNKRVTYDLFSQGATYAGSEDGAPSYTGGTVNGQQVTSSVLGGAQANFDLSVTYSIDGNKVEDLYRSYQNQERFTKLVVEPQILAVTRDIPSAYKPVEFRGEKRGEATTRMGDALNEALGKYGVNVTLVNLQNITFTAEVEQSIKNVEVAQQREAEAQANLRAAEVDAQQKVVTAQAEADAAIAKAEGEAEANRLLTQSLTPQVLEQRRIEAMKAGTVFVVPEGSQPLVQVQQGAAQ